MHDPNDLSCLRRTWQEATDDVLSKPLRRRNIIPSAVDLDRASSSLVQSIPDNGFGVEKTTNHLWQDVVPGLNSQSLSSSYFGFVTGGVTPAARVAECVVSTFDQNVQVHMPDHSVATTVEDRALGLLLELLHFEPAVWPTRTFTTGDRSVARLEVQSADTA